MLPINLKNKSFCPIDGPSPSRSEGRLIELVEGHICGLWLETLQTPNYPIVTGALCWAWAGGPQRRAGHLRH